MLASRRLLIRRLGVKVRFAVDGNSAIEVDSPLGSTVLEAAHENDVELEGACDGSLACSTCHVVVSPEYYSLLPPPSESELDLLDQVPKLEPTSRLGCQITLTPSLSGILLRIPSNSR